MRAISFSVEGVEHVAVVLPRDSARFEGLTPAERTVIERVLAGATNREIARARGVSERTVANQLASAFRKLGVRSRAELVAKLS